MDEALDGRPLSFAPLPDLARGDIPHILFRRFSKKEHAIRFLEEGRIFCRNLLYFRLLEKTGDERGDSLEAEVSVLLPDDAKLFMQIPETGEWHHLKTTRAEFNKKIPEPERVFVSCYSTQNRPENQTKFGKYLVTIEKPEELIDRFRLANISRESLSWGTIQYYEPIDPNQMSSKHPIWMRKRYHFKTECEFRIAVAVLDIERIRNDAFVAKFGHSSIESGMSSCAIEITIGSIADIATLSTA